jgi:hypothetical protein
MSDDSRGLRSTRASREFCDCDEHCGGVGIGSRRLGSRGKFGEARLAGETEGLAIEFEHVRRPEARQGYKTATIERGVLSVGTVLKESWTELTIHNGESDQFGFRGRVRTSAGARLWVCRGPAKGRDLVLPLTSWSSTLLSGLSSWSEAKGRSSPEGRERATVTALYRHGVLGSGPACIGPPRCQHRWQTPERTDHSQALDSEGGVGAG